MDFDRSRIRLVLEEVEVLGHRSSSARPNPKRPKALPL
jgi:hypothetical protein